MERSILSFKALPASHGPIVNLIGPQGLGQDLKPFIFLDFFNAEVEPGFGFGMHPHSGIATLTYQPGSDVRYEDTTGQNGILKAGGLEWMNAGGGAWHQGQLLGTGFVTGFQLWVAMPAGVEDGPAVGQYVAPEDVPQHKSNGVLTKVLLGHWQGLSSPIQSHQDMDYFAIELSANTSWQHQTPAEHSIAWAFVYEGDALVNGQSCLKQLVIFDDANGDIQITSESGAKVMFGSAVPHAADLVLGRSSVHTNAQSLAVAQQKIRQIGLQLQQDGRL
ncbi:pirin family protein [Hydromonas duriensis]|uniref:Redox-sensitive bicupin YhaK (Pirin superfamily) n=1 Tax=Hydromonas duriensis TaxID=1527608 RepID=A0A4R6Y8Q5_9BURK|nr:pirin family protein [Hydromonas duriensis]TDR31796.1 redox-sensitive bicupin YhaK (pirin superfamily) [Hydromonas duriensis]